MSATIRTVLGDIRPQELGVCNAHDHLFLRSPMLPGQQLDSLEAAAADLRTFAQYGGGAVAQWTPYGMGRNATGLLRLSQATGVHIIAATGLHQAHHYQPAVLAGIEDRLANLFINELTRDSQLRAGLIKVAGSFHHLDAHARRTMSAAASAHWATNAPIAVHLEGGTAGMEVIGLLCGELDVPPGRIILGHLNRFPDPGMHRDLAEAGVFLAFDGPSRANHSTDWLMFDCLTALVEAGHSDQVLLGGDTTVAAAQGAPGMGYLLSALRPRIERELGPDAVARIFIDNPARAFATEWP
ncbi:phosphotriesterase-related protein [Kibdelosporangium banguiense]|uniref:Phosphotriesterase-related protein n=1 Tax=Kibdelosporangium banguiense TaxID=1365924 RepID=A0ABS4TSH9_9PSEU|nr:phosphotriesterase [Kibdelosporangium banguiense]MBP2327364.1 phosphotriesterase-related protein [Kibdelosporangium banguiense]